jgi:hypothetical protein
MRGFQKGHNISGGRPKGAKNKKTVQWELFSEWMMSKGLERFQEEMNKLEGKDFVLTVKDMMEYFQPKLSRSDNHNTHDVGATLTEVLNKLDGKISSTGK